MKLDQSLPWNDMFGGAMGFLLTRARSSFIHDIERELAPLNISSAQFLIVINIAHKRATTLTEFCHHLGYDSGAMKRLLDRVEEKGLIRRVRSHEDRRCQMLELTDEGRALYPGIMTAVRTVHARLLTGFTPEEVAQFQDFLLRVISSSGQR